MMDAAIADYLEALSSAGMLSTRSGRLLYPQKAAEVDLVLKLNFSDDLPLCLD
jgi:hypothetical protein